jgi:AcrR family transcriptional regulator
MARYNTEQKEQTRERIVAAAGRTFRKGGYSGIGVDGLAKEAGVTSGAFYGHFESKKVAFEAALVAGLSEVSSSIARLQQENGAQWWEVFAKFYMNNRRTCDLAESCALQSLTPEIGRSDETIRAIFENELLKIAATINEGSVQKPSQVTKDNIWASLAMLIGGVTLARAVKDQSLSDEIAHAVQNRVIAMQNEQKD